MAQIAAAMDHLDAQKLLNYSAAVRLYGIPPSMLAWQYEGISVLRAEAILTYY
jgi:hypothetical protein